MANQPLAYYFGDGPYNDKSIFGGKGQSLALMTKIGLPVPPGFTIPTYVCNMYFEAKEWPKGLKEEVRTQVKRVEKDLGLKFGDDQNPLLFSVRSGAKVSMPVVVSNVQDTVLNLGLNDKAVLGLARSTNNERFAWDSYRRFIQMFGDVVMNVEHDLFEHEINVIKKAKGYEQDTDMDIQDLKDLVTAYKRVVMEAKGESFPLDPEEQLEKAINAVFASFYNKRAFIYRNLHNLPHDMGTAVNVQSMVFGNMGETSGTGVGFTRDPATGTNQMYGEFLSNAQGEDVVAGIRTPIDVNDMASLGGVWPRIYDELVVVYKTLEGHYKDMVDLEFTIQEGKLFMLQARVGKRTAAAMVKVACELIDEGVIDERELVRRMDADKINELLHPRFDPSAKKDIIAKGLPASPGAAVGAIVFTADEAVRETDNGKKVILVRLETSPEDVEGMHKAQGILTARGGQTSHAAVVARGMGKCCVAGCSALHIDYSVPSMTVGDRVYHVGDIISLDGSLGQVCHGAVPTINPEMSGYFGRVMEIANKFKTMQVRTNGDNPNDAKVAREFGAEGIGLCRTEHMFFEKERILHVRQMIFAETTEDREKALDYLLPYQREDFEGIFTAMDGCPVNIRLLDPPLHEFLPQEDNLKKGLGDSLGLSMEKVEAKIQELHESNPMIGFRGCRLGMIYPEISKMQVRAIMEAACNVTAKGIKTAPEIMIPVTMIDAEIELLVPMCHQVAKQVIAEKGVDVAYTVGSMIEIPTACILADKFVKGGCEFFSFGTNDLTQTGMGLSRDDSGKFLPIYVQKGWLERDPFQTIHPAVGELIKIAVKNGRSVKPDFKIGICGEQAACPVSIAFLNKVGLNYVSCSPYRVPVARMACAIAAVEQSDLE